MVVFNLLFFILLIFNINFAIGDYGTILSYDPESLSILAETNVTFTTKLLFINGTSNSKSKHFYVNLEADVDGITLNPYEFDFNFGPNENLSEQKVHLTAYKCGYTEISATNESQIDNLYEAFIRVTVYKYEVIQWVILATGWIYFLAWSLSFYPQIYTNFKSKSVVGLNLDYVALNFVGHTSYCIFNVGLKFVPFFKTQYFSKHPHGVNPIQLNDVLFSSHAVFGTFIQVIQCIIYERGGQKISKICILLLSIIFLVIIIGLILAIVNVHDFLSFLYFFSYIKLAITFLKYCPQAYQNWKCQSTKGWSIGFVIMDIIGGLNSILQMILIAYNFDDWESIFGDLGKLGLGVLSVLFDILFFFQHYILYNENNERSKAKSNVSQVGLVLDGIATHM